jgi:hypothetical protein
VPKQIIPILEFAYRIGFTNLYDWQCRVLLRYEAGEPVALAACNYSGKTSTIFVITSLWTLANFPTARLMFMSSTHTQVAHQFFPGFDRFRSHKFFSGWQWLESEVRTPAGGFCFGRSSDVAGFVEGIHDQHGSPAGLLIDEAKSIRDDILDTFERCHTTFRLLASSTGAAFGRFYEVMTSRSHHWRTFRTTSAMCPHIDPATIEADRQNLKPSVFAIKHACEFLYDEGQSMVSLEHVRELLANPPPAVPGKVCAFCDFAAGGDENVLAICSGNVAQIIDCWRSKDTMNTLGRFLAHFRRLGLRACDIAGDEGGLGHVCLDRLQEQNWYLLRSNNGSPAKRSDIFCNLAAEQWSTVAQLIERKAIVLPPGDEKLVAQLTSRRKLYDSRGREKLESKADLRSRGIESPDRGDAVVGAIILAQRSQVNWAELRELRDEINRRPPGRYAGIFPRTHLDW